MKKRVGKVNKGGPSGLIVSLIFHAVAFFVAGIFVVFTVLPKSKPVFQPPPAVERPKMVLKKPKVKIKKSSSPKPSSRIVAKVQMAKMPEISIPDLVGTGEGLLGGLGGMGGDSFGIISPGSPTRWGSVVSTTGNDLIGTFYDFKRRSSGNMLGTSEPDVEMRDIFSKFLDHGWDKQVLSKFYKAPQKLYTTTLVIPETPSLTAPMAFGVNDMPGGCYMWGVLYEGTLVSYRDIKFRFWGMGDNYLFVGLDKETVFAYWLDGLDGDAAVEFSEYVTWDGVGTPLTYAYGKNSDWIELKAGESKKMQILLGESDGGGSSFMLCVEEYDVDYPLNPFLGGRTYPIFQMEVQSQTQVEELERVIYPGDASVNEGPVFQDYEPRKTGSELAVQEEEAVPVPINDIIRTWTRVDGKKTVTGKLAGNMGDRIWVMTESGEKLKIFTKDLSADDLEYLKQSALPQLKIRFSHRSDQQPLPPQAPGRDYETRPVTIMDYEFGAEVTVVGNRSYDYPLTIEYFAIGEEIEGNNFVLWERKKETFTPSPDNDYSHEFHGETIRQIESMIHNTARVRGENYGQYLVIVTDQRGEVIGHNASKEWLFTYLDRLKKIPLTRHFNDKCERVAPPRPKDGDRIWATESGGVFDRSSE